MECLALAPKAEKGRSARIDGACLALKSAAALVEEQSIPLRLLGRWKGGVGTCDLASAALVARGAMRATSALRFLCCCWGYQLIGWLKNKNLGRGSMPIWRIGKNLGIRPKQRPAEARQRASERVALVALQHRENALRRGAGGAYGNRLATVLPATMAQEPDLAAPPSDIKVNL